MNTVVMPCRHAPQFRSQRAGLARRLRLSCATSIPRIIQDIRYAGANNFVGRPLAGYGAAECVVKREVGLALKSVQQELAHAKAVAEDARLLPPGARRRRHGGVVAGTAGRRRPSGATIRRSASRTCSGWAISPSIPAHSTGAALDLTLVDLTADNSATFDPAKSYADCTAPAEARAPEGSVDMGTGYDCSDVKAHTAAAPITPAQRRWRNVLVAAMARQGFVNYSKEWWHFSLPGAGGPAYDFPITALVATQLIRLPSHLRSRSSHDPGIIRDPRGLQPVAAVSRTSICSRSTGRWSRRSPPMAARGANRNCRNSASIGVRPRWRRGAASPTRTRRSCGPSIPAATGATRSSFIRPITS